MNNLSDYILDKINKVSKDKRNNALLITAIFLLLIFSYAFIIQPEFGYMYSDFNNNFSFFKFVFILLLFVILLTMISFIESDFLYLTSAIIFTYLFFGESIIYIFNNDQTILPLFAIFVLITILYSFRNMNFNLPRLPELFSRNLDRWIIVLTVICFLPFVFYYFQYINIKNLFFIDIYESRALFREIQVPSILGYIREPLSRIFLPYLIVKKIDERNYKQVTIFSLMLMYIYLCGAVKSIFFGLVFAIFFFGRNNFTKVRRFLLCYVIVLLFGILLYYLLGRLELMSIFRRILYVPPRLEKVYFDYFNNNYTYFSQTGFGFISYPYDKPLPLYIGDVMGYSGMSANVGVITDGFVSLGYPGMFLYTMIFALFIIFYKSLNANNIFIGIFLVYIYYFNTSLLSTLLLTHGLAIFILFSYIFLKKQKKEGVQN